MDEDDMNIKTKPGIFTISSKITEIKPSYEGLHSEESVSLSYIEEEIEELDSIRENNNNSSSLSSSFSNHQNQQYNKKIIIKKKSSKSNLKEVPYTFTWDEGGKDIKLTGTFNDWSKFYEMKYFPEEKKYKCTLNLPRKKFEYKFVVDNIWKYSQKQPIIKDNKNNINNFIDLTNYIPDNMLKENISQQSINERDEKRIKIKKKVKKPKEKTKEKKIIRKKRDRGYGLVYPDRDILNSEAPVVINDYLETFLIDSHTNQNFIGRAKYFNYKITEPFTEEKSYKTLLLGPHININHSLKCVENKNLLEMGINFRFRDKNCTLVYYSHFPKEENNN